MEWLEILKIHKGLDLFFSVSIPTAIQKNETFEHLLFICPDDEVRRQFVEELIKAIQPLAVELPYCGQELVHKEEENTPMIHCVAARWNSATTEGEMASLLTQIQERDVIMLNKGEYDLSASCGDLLYSALDTFGLDITIGKGTSAKSIRLDLPKFTFVACVAKESDELSMAEPHFSYVIRISKEEVSDICEKAICLFAMEEGTSVTDDACAFIANSASYDCKMAISYTARVVEYMRHYHDIGTQITEEHAKRVLGSLGVKSPNSKSKPDNDIVAILRDIQKKLNSISAEAREIKAIIKGIQGSQQGCNLSDITEALDRIEENLL